VVTALARPAHTVPVKDLLAQITGFRLFVFVLFSLDEFNHGLIHGFLCRVLLSEKRQTKFVWIWTSVTHCRSSSVLALTSLKDRSAGKALACEQGDKLGNKGE